MKKQQRLPKRDKVAINYIMNFIQVPVNQRQQNIKVTCVTLKEEEKN